MTAARTTDLLALDIRSLAKNGRLVPNSRCTVTWTKGSHNASIGVTAQPNAATLRYITNGTRHSYNVPITWTECNFGGRRAWWLCLHCKRQCAILYGGSVFVCRKCAHLHYPSQHASDTDRFISRAEAIRSRLGWQRGIANAGNGKPKGMHWKTYRRLVQQHEHFAAGACLAIANKYNLRG